MKSRKSFRSLKTSGNDVELLEKFMKGNVYLRDGSRGDSVSMKSQLPRLRELLGVEESGHR